MFSNFHFVFYPCSIQLRLIQKILLSIFILSLSISQERIGDWNCFTSTLNIKDITVYNGNIYCATEGGILHFDLQLHTFTPFTKLNGLNSTNLSLIETGQDQLLWVGGNSPGFIQRFDPVKEMVVKEFPYEFSEISHIASGDSIAYAVYRDNQDWGIAEYRYEDGTFNHRDLFPVWNLAENGINDIEIIGNFVFIGTESGLFRGITGGNPNSWSLLSEDISGNVTDIEISGDSLLFIENSDIFSFNLDSEEIIGMSSMNVSLINSISTDNIWGINSSFTQLIDLGENEIINLPSKANCISSYRDSLVMVGMEVGLFIYDLFRPAYEVYIPNTLPTNQISALTILNDGRLVAGSYKGLSILEDWGWRNIIETSSNEISLHDSFDPSYFSADTIPVDFGGYIADIEQGPNSKVYCAIRGTYPEPRRHGGGIVIIDMDNPADFTLIDTTHLDYFLNEYMVVKDLTFDKFGNLWVADSYATTKFTPVHKMSPEGSWTSFSYDDSDYTFSLTPNTIAIDTWNRIWIGFFTGEENTVDGVPYPNGGLMMMSQNGNDIFVNDIDLSSVYTNKSIWSVAVVRDRLYALSPNGLTYFNLQNDDANPVKRQGPVGVNGTPFAYFPQVSFGGPDPGATLKADPQNNIWAVSPTQGVYVLLDNTLNWPDAEGIREQDTPLLSDQISDIVFDTQGGLAYIATSRGINSLKIPFSEQKKDYSNLKVFPSPFYVPSEKPLVIAGIVQSSSLLVTTITGKAIRSIKHAELGIHGDQITWDGRNKEGKLVGSGVYLLSVYDQNGINAVEKITVIRK
ncbi:MAG: hypothetical protein QGH24_04840 [Candidatus Marinimicrobia bacterium]|nr:hypothetical protein [Candidatus Neomarinimicrobiota bacterium]